MPSIGTSIVVQELYSEKLERWKMTTLSVPGNIWWFWKRWIANCLSADLVIGPAWTAYRTIVWLYRLAYVCDVFLDCFWHWSIAVKYCTSFHSLSVGKTRTISLIVVSIWFLRSGSSALLLTFSLLSLSRFSRIDCASAALVRYTNFLALSGTPYSLVSDFKMVMRILIHLKSWSRYVDLKFLQD